jgi:hypothetical protein
MPEFNVPDKTLKLIISFETEQDREKFVEEKEIRILTKGIITWSTWHPYKERENRDNEHE